MKLRAGDKWKRNFKHLLFDHSGMSFSSVCLTQGNNPNLELPPFWLSPSHTPVQLLNVFPTAANFYNLSSVSEVGITHLWGFLTSNLQFHGGQKWFCCRWWLHRGHWGSVSQTGFWDLDKQTLLWILCHTLDEMLETWAHCCRSHGMFWKQMGITKDCWPASPHPTAVQLLSAEMMENAGIHSTSHCCSYQTITHGILLPLLPYSTNRFPQEMLMMISDKLHSRLCRDSLFCPLNYLPSHFQLRQELSKAIP